MPAPCIPAYPAELSVLHANALRDAFHLPPTRIGRPEVPLHVVQQARHLTQEVIVRGEVEEGGFGCVEIAHRAFEP